MDKGDQLGGVGVKIKPYHIFGIRGHKSRVWAFVGCCSKTTDILQSMSAYSIQGVVYVLR